MNYRSIITNAPEPRKRPNSLDWHSPTTILIDKPLAALSNYLFTVAEPEFMDKSADVVVFDFSGGPWIHFYCFCRHARFLL